MWWDHFVEQHVPLVRKVVRVHMDEPSICMWQGGMRQLVKVERRVNRFLVSGSGGCVLSCRHEAEMLAVGLHCRRGRGSGTPATHYAVE